MENLKKKRYFLWAVLAACLSMAALLICFAALRVYPFGENSVMTNDCYVQYVDYYRYFKEVLSGNAHIGYSFSKSLGGSLIALFGYYLASPLNLLIVLFPISKMELFVFTVTLLKIGLCGLTFSLFIQHRFKNMKPMFGLMLSLGYAFTQYNVGQLSNLGWLDGVYMLPLILWGIWRYVSEKKKGMFYISIAASIVFNWYTGYMNCLFAVLYFLYEQILWNHRHGGQTLKKLALQFLKFCGVELLGVFLSCAVFLPVVLGQSGGRGAMDAGIFAFGTNGSLLDILRGFMIGTPNMGLPYRDSTITLFCSVFLMIFVIMYFMEKHIKPFHKVCTAALISVMVFSEYFKPLEHIWCGFKLVDSFRIRFAYLTIFTLIFTAAWVLEEFEHLEHRRFVKICGSLIGLFFIMDFIRGFDSTALWLQTGLLVFYGLVLWGYGERPSFRKPILVGTAFVFFAEILANGYFVASDVYHYPAGDYETYSESQAKLVADIQSYNGEGFYRMEENENRERKTYDHSFMSNESLAYGYYGIQQYSSSYDKKASDFITEMGYCKSYFPSMYSQPILAADSLLGVKYLMASDTFYGWEAIESIERENDKKAYENPYALPLGFGVSGQALNLIEAGDPLAVETIQTENPFEFQNQVYSALLGEEVLIYEPVEVVYDYDDVTETLTYTLPETENDAMIYGYTRSVHDRIPQYVNDTFSRYYWNIWGADGIFEVGVSDKVQEVRYETRGIGTEDKRMAVEAQRALEGGDEKAEIPEPWIDSVFYKMNLDVFTSAVEKLKQSVFREEVFEDGHVIGSYVAEADGWMMLTIPNEESWEVKVNGEIVQGADGVNTFMTVPVKRGENRIEMTYHPKGISAGLGLTVLSVILFVCWSLLERRKDRKQ